MTETRTHEKQRFGVWAYLLSGIRTALKSRQAVITIYADGRIYRHRALGIVISNAARTMEPYLALTPGAKPDDGKLDVCFIKIRTLRDYLPAIQTLRHHPRPDTHERRISYFQAKRLRIESKPLLNVQADGNLIGTTPVDVEILPGRLQVMVPPETLAVQTAPDEIPRPAKFSTVREIMDMLRPPPAPHQ